MSGPLDRQRIVELFDELSDELRFTRTRAQIYIIGGAAMSLAFSRDRLRRTSLLDVLLVTTRDVDARIDTGHSRLTEAVRKIGRKYGLGDPPRSVTNGHDPPAPRSPHAPRSVSSGTPATCWSRGGGAASGEPGRRVKCDPTQMPLQGWSVVSSAATSMVP